jgi:hypothetical protein
MAHFPRWVQSDSLDSLASFSAYRTYLQQCDDEGRLQEALELRQLWSVCHGRQPSPWDAVAKHVSAGLERACYLEPCRRCRLGLGGWSFRWMDARWYDAYLVNARSGAWSYSFPELKTVADLISSVALGGGENLTAAEVVAYAALGDGLQQQPQQQQQPAAQLSTSLRLANSCRRSHV